MDITQQTDVAEQGQDKLVDSSLLLKDSVLVLFPSMGMIRPRQYIDCLFILSNLSLPRYSSAIPLPIHRPAMVEHIY